MELLITLNLIVEEYADFPGFHDLGYCVLFPFAQHPQ